MERDRRFRATAMVAPTATVLSLLWAGAAFAAHVPVVTGTWAAQANQTTGSLVMTQFISARTCKPVTGTIFGNPIEGFYCPSVGRLVFARKTSGSGSTPFQFYEAHVSRDGAIDRIGGSFAVWNFSGGGLANEGVDFNFSATRP